MAVYKFRVMFEDDDQVYRDIEISSTQNFSDFRQAILKAYNITKDWNSFFYVSNNKWHKGNEVVAFVDGETKETTAGKQKMAKFIDDPHQRFLFSIRSLTEVVLLAELMKILPDDPKTGYPRTAAVIGEFPKQFFNMLNGIKEDNKAAFLDPELAEFDAKMGTLDAIEEPGDDDIEEVEDILVADSSEISEMEVEVAPDAEPSEDSEAGEDEMGDAGEAGFEDMVSDEEA